MQALGLDWLSSSRIAPIRRASSRLKKVPPNWREAQFSSPAGSASSSRRSASSRTGSASRVVRKQRMAITLQLSRSAATIRRPGRLKRWATAAEQQPLLDELLEPRAPLDLCGPGPHRETAAAWTRAPHKAGINTGSSSLQGEVFMESGHVAPSSSRRSSDLGEDRRRAIFFERVTRATDRLEPPREEALL